MIIIRFFKRIFFVVLSLIILGYIVTLLTFYGPLTNLRELYVTTAMTTYSHQYLATYFIPDVEIKRILTKNSIKEPEENSHINAIQKPDININNTLTSNEHSPEDIITQKEIYEKQLEELKKIQLIDIDGVTFKGHLMIVNDPSRVKLVYTKKLGSKGEKLKDICANNPHIVGGINAGGFMDQNGNGWGGTPTECIISDYKVIFGEPYRKYNLIGFNNSDVLVLGKYTLEEAKALNIRDAVGFAPFLIINGEPMIKQGNGGWGIAPRSAIGQTIDGKVLLLTIDGRQVHSIGATLKDVQDIMLEYGAYNASNLDGGSTSVMYLNGELINSPSSQYGERHLPSAFVIEKR